MTVLERPVSFSPKWTAGVVVGWLVTTVVCFVVVVYALGPMMQNNDQRAGLTDIRSQTAKALEETKTLLGAAPPTKPPEFGSPVAVVEIPRLRLQQVVFEGVSPGETASGPGHVPGTAGLGQPGNAALAGRYSGYGAPFGRVGELTAGDQIVVATTQGKSVYTVTRTDTRALDEDADYGKTPNDRLTLVTSASWWPVSSERATVVTAAMDGKPFRPTPQNGRAGAQDGRSGDSGAWAALVLSLGGFFAAAAGATYLYRRWRPVSTYIITTPALLALAVLAAAALWRLLPAWT
ncbi:sortase [Amycolatopsis pigmentata]|uniref:Sortase n=1 Tax=Amycolatopsis pigmentata TaxID=450801 RepID=A0ABW5FMV2_9PSEU